VSVQISAHPLHPAERRTIERTELKVSRVIGERTETAHPSRPARSFSFGRLHVTYLSDYLRIRSRIPYSRPLPRTESNEIAHEEKEEERAAAAAATAAAAIAATVDAERSNKSQKRRKSGGEAEDKDVNHNM